MYEQKRIIFKSYLASFNKEANNVACFNTLFIADNNRSFGS